MTQLTVLLFLAYVSAHRKGQLCFSPHKGRPERRLSGETPRPWSSRQILLSKGSQSQKLRPVWPHLHGTPKTGTLPETPSRPREGAAADTQGCPLQADGNVPGGFPGSSDGKESACNAGDPPGSGRSPGEGNGYPLQYSCLETPRDGADWQTTYCLSVSPKSQTRLGNFTYYRKCYRIRQWWWFHNFVNTLKTTEVYAFKH